MVRYLKAQILRDLPKKMVLVGGARQVGKTTLALGVVGRRGYLNYDVPEDRERILNRQWPAGRLLALDEVHKYRSWRGLLKGLTDDRRAARRILVTGSARLDFYRRGGDSLQGRYHYLRLHPLSPAELRMKRQPELLELFQYGGFPEPFFGKSLVDARRWSREYRVRLIQEDIGSLERVTDVGNLELLTLRLPALTGSPLSINALREDLMVSHRAVSSWMDILERMYFVFRIPPFTAKRLRGVRKEKKHYHTDWTLVAEEGARFENMTAVFLLKWVHYLQDTQGLDYELKYFRDVDRREVDFVLTLDGQPVLFVECKLGESPVHPALRYLTTRFPGVRAWQISLQGKKDYSTDEGIRVAPAIAFFRDLI